MAGPAIGIMCIIDYDRVAVYHFPLHSIRIILSVEKNLFIIILLLRFFPSLYGSFGENNKWTAQKQP